jgi:peptidoglycan/xylan/chitin deacetylase (PgdA/CDA1 family)
MLWLSDAAARATWDRVRLEMGRRSRDLPGRLRLAWIAWRAARAQRRLDRRLDAGPGVRFLPWFWLPSPQGSTALLLALAACGVTGGPPPDTRAMALTATVALRPPQATADTPLARIESAEPQRPLAAPGRHAGGRSRDTAGATAEDITRGDLRVPEVAFTFDGGADANVAGEILDSLRARNAHATMFLTGQFIRLYPELVRRMGAEGHEVGNHLDTHPHLTTYERDRRQQTLPAVTREFLVGQLRRTEESFRALTGQPMAPFWRAPFGEHNPEIRGWAAAAGYRHISWTRGAGMAEDLDTRDWVADRSSRIYRSRDEIATRLMTFGRGRPEGLNGGIVLMHLASHRPTDRPHDSLPHILRTLQEQGYRAVTISALVRRLQDGEGPAGRLAPAPAPDEQPVAR